MAVEFEKAAITEFADWYDDYPQGPQIDPSGPSEGVDRVLRGGSWGSGGRNCRAAYRDGGWPDERHIIILKTSVTPPRLHDRPASGVVSVVR